MSALMATDGQQQQQLQLSPICTEIRKKEVEALVSTYKIACNRKKRRMLMEMSSSSFKSYEIGIIVADCCRKMDLHAAYRAYCDGKKEGIFPAASMFSNLLALMAGFGEQGSGLGPRRSQEPPSDVDAALEVFADMQQLGIPLNESNYSAMIRCSCLHGKLSRALTVYRTMQAQGNVIPKLRTFTHLLMAFCDAPYGDVIDEVGEGGEGGITLPVTACDREHQQHSGELICYTIFDELVDKYELTPSEREYNYVLRLASKRLTPRCRRRFYDTLHTMMEDVPVPETADTWIVLSHWFSTELGSTEMRTESGDDVHQTIGCCHNTPSSSSSALLPSSYRYTVATSLVTKDGTLHCNGERLRSLDLGEEQRAQLLSQLCTFAAVRDEHYKVKLNNKLKHQLNPALAHVLHNTAPSRPPPPTVKESSKGDEDATAVSDFGMGAGGESHSKVEEKLAATESDQRGSSRTGGKGHTESGVCDEESRRLKWGHFTSWLEKKYYNTFISSADGGSGRGSSSGSNDASTSTSAADPLVTAKQSNNGSSSNRCSTVGNGDDSGRGVGGGGFDIVVDGANVGYFKQNFAGAPSHVDHAQIEQLLQHLRRIGRKPLLILHSRHLSRHMLPDERSKRIARGWQEQGLLYATPRGFNDDWFWLYAAVAYRCQIVTNDEMRDHHFQMLSPRWFARWRERNRVQFGFGAWKPGSGWGNDGGSGSGSSGGGSDSSGNGGGGNGGSGGSGGNVQHTEFSPDVPAPAVTTTPSALPTARTDSLNDSEVSQFTMTSMTAEGTSHIASDAPIASSTSGAIQQQSTTSNRSEMGQQHQLLQRRVYLRFPRLYSYCMQRIESEKFCGYYFPPVSPAFPVATNAAPAASASNGQTNAAPAASASDDQTHAAPAASASDDQTHAAPAASASDVQTHQGGEDEGDNTTSTGAEAVGADNDNDDNNGEAAAVTAGGLDGRKWLCAFYSVDDTAAVNATETSSSASTSSIAATATAANNGDVFGKDVVGHAVPTSVSISVSASVSASPTKRNGSNGEAGAATKKPRI